MPTELNYQNKHIIPAEEIVSLNQNVALAFMQPQPPGRRQRQCLLVIVAVSPCGAMLIDEPKRYVDELRAGRYGDSAIACGCID